VLPWRGLRYASAKAARQEKEVVGLCWVKMRSVLSGDVSDEARGNIRSLGDRVGEVGSRDSGQPRAQPHKR
jgi:hypothetical protein